MNYLNEMSDESTTRRLSQIFGSLSCLSDFQGNDSPRYRQPQNTINPPEQLKYIHDNTSDPEQQQQQQQQPQPKQKRPKSPKQPGSFFATPIQQTSPFEFSLLQQQQQQQQQQNAIPSSSSNQIKTNQRLSSSYLLQPIPKQPQPHILMKGSRSTPNSPRLMPKRSGMPPAIPKRPQPPPASTQDHIANSDLDSETLWPHLSLLTDNLDVHQVNNYNHQGLPEINWQERCLELQLELHRSKNQAGRIRDMLRDKLSEVEQRVLESESRAEEAEEKVRAMEQRLTEWPKTTLVTQQPELNTDTEKTISQLEVQIEEQRLLRLQDAKQVEAKAEKIKVWVTNKLRDLEEQNQVLREQNSICNNQLEIIRNYLATQSYKNSANNNNNGNITNNNPLRNSLSLDVNDRKQRNSRRRSESLDPPENRQLRSLNPNHPSYPYTHRRNLSMEPNDLARDLAEAIDGLNLIPLPKNKNVIDSNNEITINEQSSTNAAAAAIGSCVDRTKDNTGHDYAEIYTPSREKAPLWLKGILPSGGGGGPSMTMTTTSSIKSDSICDLDDAPRPPTPPLHRFPSWEAKIYQVANDGLTANGENEHVSRERNSNIALNNSVNNNNNDDNNNNNNNNNNNSNNNNNYAEGDADDVNVDGGVNNNDNGDGDVSVDVNVNVDVNDDNNNNNNNNNQQHKHNSDHYYNANNEMGNATNVTTTAHDFNRVSTPRSHTVSGGYCDISVPVYATVKGRASQIRSMPFTGDSSDDSSDGEDHPALMTCTTSTHNSHNSSSTDNTETNTSGSASSPSKSLKTSSNLSPAKRSGSESPKNPVDRDSSFVSGMSDDYAIPPDAVSQSESTCVDVSIPSLMMRVSYVDSPNKKIESFEKIGHLAKLGGKLKTWRKRWFVLKNETLTYWKSQNDVNRKPQGQILLDESCRITRADGASTFEIDTGKKVYYLTADSNATIDDWIRVLQNVQQRYATKLLLSRDDQKATVQGWVNKVKNGHAKKCWCVLLGKMFLYFKAPAETNPLGQINMRDARVEEVEHVSDSDTEERESNGPNQARFTVAIFPANQGPTYLILPGKSERDNWLYHLTIVSGGSPNAGTQYEQIIQRLMAIDGDPLAPMWRHPILLHVKEHISSPLSSLHSEMLQREAINLFKSCQLFMSVAVNQPGIDYHVVLAQNALQQCLDIPELQAELICALVKQTSRHIGQKLGAGVQQLLLCATQSLFTCDTQLGATHANGNSPTSIQIPLIPPIDCKSNPPAYTFIQGWQLLSLAISLFIPKNNKLLWYLKLHLSRNADSKTECGKYAAYCERALERTILNGGREAKPSRMEVLSILMKNPYHHSLPHAIPVHMMNGTYQVISFDGSTSIEEFHSTLSQEIGCRESTNGFCLCSDDPIERDLEHYLDPQAKLCDVISKWETALREKGSGKFENSRVIQLTYKNRLYWKHSIKLETDKEKLLLCYQINQQIVHGRFPLSRDLAVELASLMAQIDMGDFSTEKCRGSANILASVQALDKFYPYRYRDAMTPEQLKELQEILVAKWILLKGRSTLDCVRIYLTCCRKWPYFGASLFQAKLRHSDQTIAWLAVSEDALNVLELSSMAPLARYPYSSVITFGGCQDDFMLVVANNTNNNNNNNNNGTTGTTTTILSAVVGDGVGGRSSNIGGGGGGGAYTAGTNTTTTINSDELHQYHTLVHLGGGMIGMPSGMAGSAATNEQKLLFAMSKPKILEITLLIADYMNALGHTCPGTPQMNTLTRNGSHRSIRSRPVIGSSVGGGGGVGTISSIGGASGSGGMGIGTTGGCTNTSTIGSGITHGGYSMGSVGGGGGGGGSTGVGTGGGSNTGSYCPNTTTSTINTLHSHISSHYMLNSNHLNMHNSHSHNSQPHQPDILKSTPDHQRINKL